MSIHHSPFLVALAGCMTLLTSVEAAAQSTNVLADRPLLAKRPAASANLSAKRRVSNPDGPPPLLIDDFTSGLLYRPTPDGITSKIVSAKVVGGSRNLTTYVNDNPYQQYSAVGVGRGLNKLAVGPGLFFSTGYGIAHRVDVGYGLGKPMSLNLSAYASFRVHFTNASIITLADFQAFTGSSYQQWGCNNIVTDGSDPKSEVTVDYPFTPAPGVDYANLNYVYLLLQSNANVGINKIEAVPAGAPPADFTCPTD